MLVLAVGTIRQNAKKEQKNMKMKMRNENESVSYYVYIHSFFFFFFLLISQQATPVREVRTHSDLSRSHIVTTYSLHTESTMSQPHDEDHQLSKEERVDAAKKRFEAMKMKLKLRKKAHAVDFTKSPAQPSAHQELPVQTEILQSNPVLSPPVQSSVSSQIGPATAQATRETIRDSPAVQLSEADDLFASIVQPVVNETPSLDAKTQPVPTEGPVAVENPVSVQETAPPTVSKPVEAANVESAEHSNATQNVESESIDHIFSSYGPVPTQKTASVLEPAPASRSHIPEPQESKDFLQSVSSAFPETPAPGPKLIPQLPPSKKHQLTPEDLFGPSTSAPDSSFLFQSPVRAPLTTVTPQIVRKAEPPAQPASKLPQVDPMELFGFSTPSNNHYTPVKTEPAVSANVGSFLVSAVSSNVQSETKSRPEAKKIPETKADSTSQIESVKNEVTLKEYTEPSKELINKVTSQAPASDFESLFGESKDAPFNFDDRFHEQEAVESPQANQQTAALEDEPEAKSDIEEYFGMTQASPVCRSFEDVLDIVESESPHKHLTDDELSDVESTHVQLTAENLFGTVSSRRHLIVDDLFGPVSPHKPLTAEDLFGPEATHTELAVEDLFGHQSVHVESKEASSSTALLSGNVHEDAFAPKHSIGAPKSTVAESKSSAEGLFEVDLNAYDDLKKDLDNSVPDLLKKPEPASLQKDNVALDNLFGHSLNADNDWSAVVGGSEKKTPDNDELERVDEIKKLDSVADEHNEHPAALQEESDIQSVADTQAISEEQVDSLADSKHPPAEDGSALGQSDNSAQEEIARLKITIKEQEEVIQRQRKENTELKLAQVDLDDQIIDLTDKLAGLEGEIAGLKEQLAHASSRAAALQASVSGPTPQNDLMDEDIEVALAHSDHYANTTAVSDEAVKIETPLLATGSHLNYLAVEKADEKFTLSDTHINGLVQQESAKVQEKNEEVKELDVTANAQENHSIEVKGNPPVIEQASFKDIPLSNEAPKVDPIALFLEVPTNLPSSSEKRRILSDILRKEKNASTISDFRERLMVWKGWQVDMTEWQSVHDAPKVAL